MKKLITLILAVSATLVTFANGVNINGIHYILAGDSAEVTYSGQYSSSKSSYNGNLVIPSYVTYDSINYKVTSIGEYAFSDCDSLNSVSIPNSVKQLKTGAFWYCTSLSSVMIPNTVKTIGEKAFTGCGISAITIPNSVTSIGQWGFAYCNNLKSVTLSNSVTSIALNTFCSCTSLISIEIPESVVTIEGYVFHGCSSLVSISLPNSIQSIGEAAFYNCYSLSTIYCKATVPPACGSNCFNGNEKNGIVYVPLESVSLYMSADGWKDFSNIQAMPLQSGICGDSVVWDLFDEGRLVLRGKGSMYDYNDAESPWKNLWVQSITIEEGVTRIGNHAFLACQSIESVIMSSTITSIGEAAFEQCFRLQNVNLSSNLQVIESGAFQGDSLLTEVVLPNSVTTIGLYAFSQCTGLQYPVHNDKLFARIPMSVTGHYDIPDGITTICGTAFDMSNISSVAFPSSVTHIGQMAFSYCYQLDTLTLGPNVQEIESNAFYYCTSLRDVRIGSSLTGNFIGNPFDYCESVYYFSVDKNNPRYCSVDGVIYSKDKSELVLYPYAKLGKYNIPDSTISIRSSAFWGGINVDTVTVPSSITTINKRAFCYCSGIKAIELPSTLTLIDTAAFAQCYALRSIVCLATTPPRMAYQTFGYISKLDSIKVYVPAESVEAYKSAYGWNELNIQAIPQPNNVITYTAFEKLPEAQSASEDFGLHIYAFGVPMLSHTFSDGIGKITFGGDVTSMGLQAFAYCEISSVTVPSSVTSFGDLSFVATHISSIDIPIGVDSIGDWAFQNCKSLLTINLPNTIVGLGKYAFHGCTGLTSIVSNAIVPPTCEYYTFESVDKTIPVYVPDESVNAYKVADGWKDFTNILPLTCFENRPRYYKDSLYTCEWNPIQWHGKYYYYSGTYYDTVPNQYGCDSIIYMLNLTTYPSYGYDYTKVDTIRINRGDSVIISRGLPWQRIEYPSETTTLGDTMKTIHGCDSMIIRYVIVNEPISDCPEYSVCGKCGDNVYWKLDTIVGMLDIYGQGAMYDYDLKNQAPWLDYQRYIQNVVVRDSISYVGARAFFCIYTDIFKSVTIGERVDSIGYGAFYKNNSLKQIICRSYLPPLCRSLSLIGNKNIPVYVPCGSLSLYQNDVNWSIMNNISDGSYRFIQDTTLCWGDTTLYWRGQWSSYRGNKYEWDNGKGHAIRYYSYIDSLEDRYKASTGCDSVYYLAVHYKGGTYFTYYDTIQQGETHWSGNSVTGLHFYHVYDIQGCDSNIYEIHLYVQPKQIQYYTISTAVNNTKYGSVEGAGTYVIDTIIPLTAIPNKGYQFTQWSDGNTDNPRMVLVTQDTTYTAQFAIKQCSWLVESSDLEMGAVQTTFLNEYYNYGTQITVTASPNSGYKFVKWNDGKKYNPYTFTILDDKYLLAIFMEEAEEQDTTTVQPTDTTATFQWPLIEGGYTYTLTIYSDATCSTKICTLTFNQYGQLIGIAFGAPRRGGLSSQEESFTCTVQGLSPEQSYFFKMETTDVNGKLLNTDEGLFTTQKNSGPATYLNNLSIEENEVSKFIDNNQLYILRDGKIYNAQGALVK